MTIDNQYYDWYFHKFNKKLDRSRVLPVLRALQGHPESGKLWEHHINNILLGTALNVKHTTHDRTIYQTTFDGKKVLLLRMVNDLLIQCEHKDTAKAIYTLIGLALQLGNEDEPPFAYLESCVDFNGVDIEQSNTHIMISCQNYIDRMLRALHCIFPGNGVPANHREVLHFSKNTGIPRIFPFFVPGSRVPVFPLIMNIFP